MKLIPSCSYIAGVVASRPSDIWVQFLPLMQLSVIKTAFLSMCCSPINGGSFNKVEKQSQTDKIEHRRKLIFTSIHPKSDGASIQHSKDEKHSNGNDKKVPYKNRLFKFCQNSLHISILSQLHLNFTVFYSISIS